VADRFDRERGGVVVGGDLDPAGVRGDVVDAVCAGWPVHTASASVGELPHQILQQTQIPSQVSFNPLVRRSDTKLNALDHQVLCQ
jgi:hypothetical protein